MEREGRPRVVGDQEGAPTTWAKGPTRYTTKLAQNRWRNTLSWSHNMIHATSGARTRTKSTISSSSLFVWLVADGWCWFVLREKYYWLVADGWFVVREKYCWLVADKPSEQGGPLSNEYLYASARRRMMKLSPKPCVSVGWIRDRRGSRVGDEVQHGKGRGVCVFSMVMSSSVRVRNFTCTCRSQQSSKRAWIISVTC
jgi:hypothetical protein